MFRQFLWLFLTIKKPEFNPRIVRVRFMVHRVLLGEVFLKVLGSFCMPLVLHILL